MTIILTADGQRHAVLEMSDDFAACTFFSLPVMCPGCLETHEAVYEFQGIHDDGAVYDLKAVQ